MKINIKTYTTELLADIDTPVSIYLKVRDVYPKSALLESSDYHSNENSHSIIGVLPLAELMFENGEMSQLLPNQERSVVNLEGRDVVTEIENFIKLFTIESSHSKYSSGLLGYMGFESVHYFHPEELGYLREGRTQGLIPDIYYILYRFIISIDHKKNKMVLIENCVDQEAPQSSQLIELLQTRSLATYDFDVLGEEETLVSDEMHIEMIEKAIELTKSNELNQLVVSRGFSQGFKGDEFMVYRALRSINPSPYLFYFDFGSFRIFGSSPETHCKVEGGRAFIDPIAGTYFRTGDDARDQELAKELLTDEKEVAEHDMLVEYALSDLRKNCSEVSVDFYKEVQFYSHVIHLVSRVSGQLNRADGSIKLLTDSFPAGTLIGDPKIKALKLLNEIEKENRGYYGGCIGYIGFDGDLIQAITIRSFLSKNNSLFYQAGGGIVTQSNCERELLEVKNKLLALRKAVDYAKTIKH